MISNKQAAAIAIAQVNATPKVELLSVEQDHVPSGTCGALGPDSFRRTRDRTEARAAQPPEPKTETLYEQEVRCFGTLWADRYQAQRDAEARQRADAELMRVQKQTQKRREHTRMIQQVFHELDALGIVDAVVARVGNLRCASPEAVRAAIKKIREKNNG
jgi:hypothetical protein